MTLTTMGTHKTYAVAVLDFIASNPTFDSSLTVDEFNALYEKSDAQSVGAKYGLAIHHAMDKIYIRKVVREAEIPFKDQYCGLLTESIRIIGTHNFIENILEKGNADSELVAYSKARVDKSIARMEEWATKDTTVSTPEPAPKIHHALESVSAMREMRQILETVKISILEFNEAKVKKSATSAKGKVNYATMSAQLRHNHTNYDVLRVSRKIRRNTYWKLTAQPAIRIAVCEKLLLLTEDPELHLQLMLEIEKAHAEFQRKLTTAAKAPNFIAAMDGMFRKAAKQKVFKKSKRDFMMCLETI